MTKEEILAMKPGRELDVPVAKEIFGIEVEWDYAPYDINKVLPKLPFVKNISRIVTGALAHPQLALILEYSTDISAAWQVVEKDGAWDFKKRFRPHPDDPSGSPGRPTYQAKVFLSDYAPVEDELIKKHTGRSPWVWSLPEAICKAALLAKLEA